MSPVQDECRSHDPAVSAVASAPESRLLIATDGFGTGLSMIYLHAVRWADAVTANGVRVRVFSWFMPRNCRWVFQVWPADADVATAGHPLPVSVYPDWPSFDRSDVRYTSAIHLEHAPLLGAYAHLPHECSGCVLAEHMEFLAYELAAWR